MADDELTWPQAQAEVLSAALERRKEEEAAEPDEESPRSVFEKALADRLQSGETTEGDDDE